MRRGRSWFKSQGRDERRVVYVLSRVHRELQQIVDDEEAESVTVSLLRPFCMALVSRLEFGPYLVVPGMIGQKDHIQGQESIMQRTWEW